MLASTNNLAQALKFEGITAVKKDGFASRELFAIVGMPGVWRRVTRSGTSLAKKRAGAELVMFHGAVVELVREKAVSHELRCAGLAEVAAEDQLAYLKEKGHDLPVEGPAREGHPDQMTIPELADAPADAAAAAGVDQSTAPEAGPGSTGELGEFPLSDTDADQPTAPGEGEPPPATGEDEPTPPPADPPAAVKGRRKAHSA